MRIGVIGTARVASYAVIEPARKMEGIKVLAAASRSLARAREYVVEQNIPRAHGSYAALLADPEIDLIYIATPPHTHARLAIAAIDAGKSALVEKPFSMTATEARQVADHSRKLAIPVFEAMHSPHHALFGRILEVVRAGEIGRVRSMDAEFSVPIDEADGEFRWRAEHGGGALMDLGIYPLAWLRRIAGEQFELLSSEAQFHRGVDASFTASLLFADEVSARINSSMTVTEPAARLFIEGERGQIEVLNPLAPQLGHEMRVNAGGSNRTETVEGPTSYQAQLRAVRDTLLTGKEFPFPPDDFVRSMEAIDRVRAALRLNRGI